MRLGHFGDCHMRTMEATEREERRWVLHEKFTAQIVDVRETIDRTMK
jgi:hypothetical protein